ncbi:MAG TPA: TPM domain-containing protein, partial [Candidatus Saccharimonadales bacterium]|nr:TPM domain-containing protein [Candidatus Saccharimonadales bacterium]
MRFCSFIFLWLWSLAAFAAETIPPSPAAYFNDYAHVVDAGVASQLNAKLENFERDTGNQIVVAVYPKMQSDSSPADYTVQVFRAWKVGQKAKNNGAVLFVFIQDRKIFLQVGYGLEGVLPDALCQQIIHNEIEPRFKTGDYAGGLTAAVSSILAATRQEYKGTGTTVAQRQQPQQPAGNFRVSIFALLFIGFIALRWFM